MRESFLSFLEKRGHKRINRYPVVARWRDDVFFTQASIYPFQPWVVSGWENAQLSIRKCLLPQSSLNPSDDQASHPSLVRRQL